METQIPFEVLTTFTRRYDNGEVLPQTLFALVTAAAGQNPITPGEHLSPPTLLYRVMHQIHKVDLDSEHSPLLDLAYGLTGACRGVLPHDYLDAVEANLNLIGGPRITGTVLHDGLLVVPPQVARKHRLVPLGVEPVPGAAAIGRIPVVSVRAKAVPRCGPYFGTHRELWFQFLSVEERINALRPVR